ncbi:MAG TPA: DUF4167 domain-containing protein [Xanthobacteraceae bacterium]|nr:DUF4167 domain-containing protein [Xanthobacteraceae bacterium]
MRNGQNNNKRMRGRNNNRKGSGHHHHQNPLSRVYESNGQDVKIRGTASHIAEKYLQLARDAQSSGDSIASENYYQHAEHYFRLIAAAQEQLRQSQPNSYYQQQPGGSMQDDGDGDGDDDGDQPHISGEPFAPREQQPFYPREQQPPPQQYQPQHQQPQHQQPQHQPQPQYQPRGQHNGGQEHEEDVERLPSFITGGQAAQPQPQHAQGGGQSANGQNGNGYDGGAPDRFPLHRRRRRHRSGPRDHGQDNNANTEGSSQSDE